MSCTTINLVRYKIVHDRTTKKHFKKNHSLGFLTKILTYCHIMCFAIWSILYGTHITCVGYKNDKMLKKSQKNSELRNHKYRFFDENFGEIIVRLKWSAKLGCSAKSRMFGKIIHVRQNYPCSAKISPYGTNRDSLEKPGQRTNRDDNQVRNGSGC